jgi:hypothetical protein
MILPSITPAENDPHVKRLLFILNATHEQIYVDIEPEQDAIESDCVNIVAKKVAEAGGKRILGWQIWKTNNIVEAEFHAVWETPDGDLKDLTPKPISDKQILFVEDENLVYEGKQINNIRLNYTKNPLADDFIKVCNAKFSFENKGERAFTHELKLRGNEAEKLLYLNDIKKLLEQMLLRNCTKKSICLCGSGKIYTSCHGANLTKILSAILN